MSKHYDVVVLGASLGALATAALLARRSWRVLVLGQAYRAATYSFDGLPLARRPFTFLAASSPAWNRLLAELAQSQSFRRLLRPEDPLFQVWTPRLRLSVPPEATLFAREIDREFPEVHRVVDELSVELARTNERVDAAFEQDLVWPPGSFWERRETARAVALLPHLRRDDKDLFAEFPREHPYRAVVHTPASFASDLGAPLPTLALARLFGSWTRELSRPTGGEADIVDFLVDRIRAHGGETRFGDRASEITVRHGRTNGVRVDGDDDLVGVGFVVTDLPASALLDLAPHHRPARRELDARHWPQPAARRFVTSMLVRDEGLPRPLAREAFLVPDPSSTRRRVHVQKAAAGSPLPGTTLLVTEAIVPEDEVQTPRAVTRLREQSLASVEAFFPFIERHYVLVDSPHDGLPLWDYRSGKRRSVDRALLRPGGGAVDAEPMEALFRFDREATGFDAVVGEPLRTPLAGTFGVGKTVLPALGQEGQLLAAWGAARIITRTDRRKEKMRREMWSKVEFG
jgi:phytoene dehydrogenase-like protein